MGLPCPPFGWDFFIQYLIKSCVTPGRAAVRDAQHQDVSSCGCWGLFSLCGCLGSHSSHLISSSKRVKQVLKEQEAVGLFLI